MKMKSTACLLIMAMTFFACQPKNKMIEVRNENNVVIERYSEHSQTKAKTGPYKIYTETGHLAEKGFYKNGLPDKERIVYFPEKTDVNYIEHYKEGLFDGKYQYFYENGQVELEGNYVNGAMSDNWKAYYENGQLKEIVAFVDNEENGPFVEYHENGQLKAEGQYLNGDNEDGLLKLYNEAGQLERKMECDSGRCATIWTLDPKN